MRRELVLMALSGVGCNIAFQLDQVGADGGIGDGHGPVADVQPAADACTPGTFDEGVMLDFPTDGNDPFLGPTLLELYYVVGSGSDFDLYLATRKRVEDVFTTSSQVPGPVDSQMEDTDPSITADGQRLVFRSTRTGDPRTFEAIRDASGKAFAAPMIPAGLEDVDNNGVNISADGLTVYISNNGDVRQFERPVVDAPFIESPSSPVVVNAGYPSVSPDQLEIFFDNQMTGGIGRMTRTSREDKFGNGTVFANGQDAALAADNNTLISTQNTQFLVQTRHCQ